MLLHAGSLSTFLCGCMFSVGTLIVLHDIMATVFMGFAGAIASYAGTWIAKRILPEKKKTKKKGSNNR
jgi:membrane protein DedA with SNARE-associated domain